MIQKWRKRLTTSDAPMGPKDPRSPVLTPEEEAMIHGGSASGGATMLTGMTEEENGQRCCGCLPPRAPGANGRNDRHFLETLHYFTVHNITGRALLECFSNWNSMAQPIQLFQRGVFRSRIML